MLTFSALLPGCAPWLTAIKNYARTGRDPVMRAPKTKNQYLAIERQIEKWDGNPFK